MPEIPGSQDWLINRMIQLGYMSNVEGVCYANCVMASQAMLLGKEALKQYNDRLELIAAIPIQDFIFVGNNRENYLPHRDRNSTEQITRDELIDILAFFDGIEFLQNNKKLQNKSETGAYFRDYSGLLPSDNQAEEQFQWANVERTTRNYTSSVALEEQGGLSVARSFFGVYSQASLTSMLEQFEKMANEEKFDCPVSFMLDTGKHAVTYTYLPGQDGNPGEWFFLDPNRCPIQKMQNASELAEAILSSETYSEGKIHTRIMSTGATHEAIATLADQWFETPEFRAPHEAMTSEQFKICENTFAQFILVDAGKEPELIVEKRNEAKIAEEAAKIAVRRREAEEIQRLYDKSENNANEVVKDPFIQKDAGIPNHGQYSGLFRLFKAAPINTAGLLKSDVLENDDPEKKKPSR